MAKDNFTIDGLDKLIEQLEASDPMKKVAELRKHARRAMKPVLDHMKANANVKDGDLRESIVMRARVGSRSDRGRVLTISVGPLTSKSKGKELNRIASKAGAQEYGTSAHGQKAEPFIRPALEANKRSVVENLVAGVKAEYEKRQK